MIKKTWLNWIKLLRIDNKSESNEYWPPMPCYRNEMVLFQIKIINWYYLWTVFKQVICNPIDCSSARVRGSWWGSRQHRGARGLPCLPCRTYHTCPRVTCIPSPPVSCVTCLSPPSPRTYLNDLSAANQFWRPPNNSNSNVLASSDQGAET